jgi:hypothetical protein
VDFRLHLESLKLEQQTEGLLHKIVGGRREMKFNRTVVAVLTGSENLRVTGAT